MHRLLAPLVLSVLMSSSPVHAWTQDEPLFDELTKTFKKKSLSVGILFQGVADFQIERSIPGNNGISISNSWVNISRELDGGFGYLFKTNLINSPAILDAKICTVVTPQWVIDVGLFKPLFSKEYLTGAGRIDFVNRAQVVSALVASDRVTALLQGLQFSLNKG